MRGLIIEEKVRFVEKVAKALRYYVLISTSEAGSGHPTSCLSAAEIVAGLFAGGYFKYDLQNQKNLLNDRFIISTGHKAPLLYSVWALAGAFDREKLLDLRKIDSPLEGHPTYRFPLAEVATGSLGQGLSIGAGMAQGLQLKFQEKSSKLQKFARLPKVFVLLGDSELAEGQVWEAFQWAGYRKISNLIALVDVNRLGQRGETMWDWNLSALKKRIESFDWEVLVVNDGNNAREVLEVYEELYQPRRLVGERPVAILFKTVKGKGVSFLEDKEGWHGKALDKELLQKALEELGEVDKNIKITLSKPEGSFVDDKPQISATPFVKINSPSATREAYGRALNFLFEAGAKDLVVLDAEVSNSTYAMHFAEKHPERFFEMYIAEQNMVSVALGFEKVGFTPFVSSFAAFLTRAFDQIRMAQYSKANLKIVGSHAGVSIGPDGASQMGLEDISMMRSILNSVVFYPSDYVSAFKLIELAYKTPGIVYIRTTRSKTPVIYSSNEKFEIGGYKVLKNPNDFQVVLVSAGITLHNSLRAVEELEKEGVKCKVIDLYCIKPIGKDLEQEFEGANFVLVIEDHYPYGGIFEAVKSQTSFPKIYPLAVRKIPHSGSSEEAMEYVGISVKDIVEEVRRRIK